MSDDQKKEILAKMNAEQRKEAEKFHAEFMNLSPSDQKKTLEAMRSLKLSRM